MQWVRKWISHMTCMETAYISHIKTNKLWTSWSSTLFCSQLTCAARCRVPDGWLIDHWYLRLWMLFWGAHGSAAARAVEGRRRERWGGGTKAQMLNYGCGGGRERDSSAAFTPQIAERESSSAWIKWHSPLKGWVAAMNRGYLPRLG